MRGILLRCCAALLLAICAWATAFAQEAAPSAATPEPHPGIVLANGSNAVALYLQARAWVDETGARTIDQVESEADRLPWRPRQRDQQDRLDGKALWIQFDATVLGRDHWFLEIGSAGIDRAQLFYRDRSGVWVVQEAGDEQPVSAWPVPGRVPAFALSLERTGPVRYWLRVQHSRVDFAAPLVLKREATMVAQREREQFLLGAYFGLAALIALASLANGLAYRDRAFLVYSLYVVLLGAGQLARLGIGAQHLWPDWMAWNETSSYVLPGLSTAVALWFVKVLTEPARFSRVLDLAVWTLIAATLAAVALDGFMASRSSLGLVLVCTVLSMAALVGLIAWGWRDGREPDIKLIALGFLPVIVFALFPIARGLNLIPNSPLTRYGVVIGAVLEMPILYTALRIRSLRRRESQVRAAALSHTDALTGLAHRRGLLQRLDTTLARARTQKQSCALLGVRIANMEAIVEEFGRDAGEKAVVVAASHLRRAITDIDLAARVGDHDFAVLLESPIVTVAAMSRAQQVVASGLRQIEALPAALTLKFHVTVVILPHQQLDAAASLQWVLDGLAQMPPDSRKLIRPLNF
jgi:diguanylate cyclase (GGDEF)-like protein